MPDPDANFPVWVENLGDLAIEHDGCPDENCPACQGISVIREAARDLIDHADLVELTALKTAYRAVKGTSAEVPADVWDSYALVRDLIAANKKDADYWEARLLEVAGFAAVLTVDGEKVAVRVTREVRNASWTDDHFRRVKQ